MDTLITPQIQTSPAAKADKVLRVLIADDSENDAFFLLRELRKAGYEPVHERVSTASGMRAAIVQQAWDVVISDYEMPHFGGFEALRVLKETGLDLPFILVSAVVSEETAVAAMKAGAHDYIMKRKLARLAPAIERELREAQTRMARKAAEEALRKKEEQLRHTQKMEAVGLLAASVAHDFSNILTAISGHTLTMLAELGAEDPCRKNAEQISKCAQMAGTLTKQLLAYSRKQPSTPSIFEINAAILNIEPILRRLVTRNIEFHLELQPDAGKIKGDPGQIEQILVNMVVNSRDAMPDGGKLTVSTANIRVRPNQPIGFPFLPVGNYVLLAVADTGIGMTEEVKAQIFEPFFTTKSRGTGLGLATCFDIVKQSKACIKVHSELGNGTTFKIFFPEAPEGVRPA